MGIMRSGLTDEGYDRSYTNRQLFTRIGAYFKPSSMRMAVLIVLVTVMAFIGAIQPVLIAWGVGVIDSNVANRDQIAMLLVAGVFVIGIFNWVLNWARRNLTVRLFADVVLAMRIDAFRSSFGTLFIEHRVKTAGLTDDRNSPMKTNNQFKNYQ